MKMLNDLFDESLKRLDAIYKSNPAFKSTTINDTATAQLINLSFTVQREMSEQARSHLVAMERLETKQDNLNNAMEILSGRPGFLRCNQGWANLESGFTTLQEIILKLNDQSIRITFEPNNIYFGQELWFIDDRGMMTLVDYKTDSSD